MLDRVHTRQSRDAGTVEVARVAGDPRSARMHSIGRGLQGGDREGRVLHAAGRVHIDLHQVGAEVELMEGRVL